ncbi:HAMP domain-containing sensor histidine kinase [Paenibacillus sp. UMB4589-SE434]|uniref:sensor histidine kinase n=1 Tax=Paenibacillus sp. UMB4589-SE434 TaxID=3046314 RepID=UPI002549ECBB|nr:HAMP domain-containing sensor histidine kinase [Paenibacillus sp. UMB4589-SE434]MDK8182882.1 HAMP domain-containing sensor histidine kinase [Paenibacillus sp. UMB4589-SE434]
MNKLSRKLFVRFSLIVGLVLVLSYVANTFFLPKYYLYQKKTNLAQLTETLERIDEDKLTNELPHVEHRYGVDIVHVPFQTNIDALNEAVITTLDRRGIRLSKFWITEESVAKLTQQEKVHKIFSQTKLKSSFLVTFMNKDDELYVIGESIAYSDETLHIVNRFTLYISVSALVLTLLLSAWSARRILRPLAELRDTAEQIAELKFSRAKIHTGDEIEALADSVNRMSDNLERAHQELQVRNDNLRVFISDISHELKTPLALMKAYTAGMKDGLDDGTFTDVIEQQADDMARLVERLLELSKLQADTYEITSFNFMELLAENVDKYKIVMAERSIELELELAEGIQQVSVMADRTKIEIVLNNFFTNAIKYATDSYIHCAVTCEYQVLTFRLRNRTGEWTEAELKRMWEPFSVAEQSRSKQLSGTGLGLSLVKTILEKHQAAYGARAEGGQIEFYFSLPVTLA